ncbi:MAG: hypothetical protein MPW14_15410 [Candidatus Manganitrophus sp.]|nr:hypothetical protein [Candidatus Manganitrophus sp.]WDT69800.1 MAG: hypothetical protein MPW17_13560 [Candidatus Manganitrophus sp.]WDT78571.1 MAG: hypothetical protein MPW14_15410 [Candidatus Manganitrophus sp.]
MTNEQDVLKIVIKRLESIGIRYMVTGSVAANFYITPRMTRDTDIVIEVEEHDAERLFSLFSDEFYIDLDMIKDAIRRKSIFNIIHRDGIVKIDFIIRKESEYRKLEFERKRSILFEGLSINVVSPEDLILSKLDWARDSLSEMQIRDVKNLMKTIPDLDRQYIESWVKKLGLNVIYRKVTS